MATFSRGRSDITGVILARDFNAELYENFIDVDAIFSANPAIVSNPDQMQWIADYAITMVVGEGMQDKLTLCASILYPLGQKNISIQMINQGAFQISIMIGTKRQDAEEVIRTIYQTFFN
ncbi:aspartate kinase [Lactobacillus taiwanensis DSM 21401]|nr:aspartate kinase [Lactobacillus taiwanensis DSM 21401]